MHLREAAWSCERVGEKLKQCVSFAFVAHQSCWEDGDSLAQKDVTQLKVWVLNWEFTSIMYKLSQAEVVASHSCLSVTAKDVSPVSSCPIWFSLTNITAVPSGYRADNTSVCTHMHFSVWQVYLCSVKKVSTVAALVCVCASVFVSYPIVQVCVNTWAGRCVCVWVCLSDEAQPWDLMSEYVCVSVSHGGSRGQPRRESWGVTPC